MVFSSGTPVNWRGTFRDYLPEPATLWDVLLHIPISPHNVKSVYTYCTHVNT
mgnify:CR=1 FL=1